MAVDDHLVQWLRDAHAMEVQAGTMLSQQAARIENYPQLRQRIEQHIQETHRHAEVVERCIQRRGGGTSAIKDAAGKTTAVVQGLGGMFAGDEIVKGAMAGYTFEHFEISAYTALVAAAEEAGDTETARACEQILQEEKQMAAWLAEHLPQVTRTYLERRAAGLEAQT